jgi:hypothetical protein
MLKFLVPGAAVAMLVSAAALAPATAVAAPTTLQLSQLKTGVPAGVEKVGEWNEWNGHRYRAGRRYREAPPHWHRYHRRPRDWHTRGCIVVGPIWFCP